MNTLAKQNKNERQKQEAIERAKERLERKEKDEAQARVESRHKQREQNRMKLKAKQKEKQRQKLVDPPAKEVPPLFPTRVEDGINVVKVGSRVVKPTFDIFNPPQPFAIVDMDING